MLASWLILVFAQAGASVVEQKAISGADNDESAWSAMVALQKWYNGSTGLWETTGWWNSANALTMIADFAAVDPVLDIVMRDLYENTFRQAQKANVNVLKTMTARSTHSYMLPSTHSEACFPGFINDYYDDEGW